MRATTDQTETSPLLNIRNPLPDGKVLAPRNKEQMHPKEMKVATANTDEP
jgi:hypothetical protein